jgi:hypothetical protein
VNTSIDHIDEFERNVAAIPSGELAPEEEKYLFQKSFGILAHAAVFRIKGWSDCPFRAAEDEPLKKR